MSNVATKKYQIIYSSDKAIKYVLFGNSFTVTKFSLFETNDYDTLVNYIYDENLYTDKNSKINYNDLKTVKDDVESTLFKYDD